MVTGTASLAANSRSKFCRGDSMNQRWRARRDLYRPDGEAINTREYEIAETRSDRIVKDFIAEHHYLQTTPPARFRFCLYKDEQLVGVRYSLIRRTIARSPACSVAPPMRE
jgi:hypothetical protein